MSKQSIKIKVVGLDTKEDCDCFINKCSDFWMYMISKKINELSVSYDEKVEIVQEVVRRIHEKASEIE